MVSVKSVVPSDGKGRALLDGALVTDFETQVIVPLGKVVRLGYRVKWEGEAFELFSPSGTKIEVLLEAGCPTVDMKTANQLIEELEGYEVDMTQRAAALRAGSPVI